MEEAFEDTVEELKRAEHLYFVSLKYTRTVDVIRSLIERLISTYDNGINTLLLIGKKQKKLDKAPPTPIASIKLLKEVFPDEGLDKFLDEYILFRKILRAPFDRREEYRRHVTMISHLDASSMEVNIDLLKEYYENTVDFVQLIANMLKK